MAAVKAGADAAATAFSEEERRAVGSDGHLALAAASSSTMDYLSDELVRRAERLEAHGSRKNVSKACADAAELLRQFAAVPADPTSKPLEQVPAIERISQAAAQARTVHEKSAVNCSISPAALPLDRVSVLDLLGGPDHEWFLRLFSQRYLPEEARAGVDVVRRTQPRGEQLSAILPPALCPPEALPPSAPAAARVPLTHAAQASMSRPLPKRVEAREAKAHQARPAAAASAPPDVSVTPHESGISAHVAVKATGDVIDGPFSVPAAGLADSGDLYADFISVEPASRGSLGSKRRASARSRASSDSAQASRASTTQGVNAGAATKRPSAEVPQKQAEAPVPQLPKLATPKSLPAGIMPATGRNTTSKRLPAGLLPASMAKPEPPASKTASAPGLLPPPGEEQPNVPLASMPAHAPGNDAVVSDLPPPPPLAGQVYSRVPAAMAAAPASGDVPLPTDVASGATHPAPEPSDAPMSSLANAALDKEQLSSILRDPQRLQELLRQDSPVGRFLRQKLANALQSKGAGK